MMTKVEVNEKMMEQVTGGASSEELTQICAQKNALRREYESGRMSYEEYIARRDMNRRVFQDIL